jgi:hypothetical protein
VIRSFADAATEDLFNGKATKAALAFDRRICPSFDEHSTS